MDSEKKHDVGELLFTIEEIRTILSFLVTRVADSYTRYDMAFQIEELIANIETLIEIAKAVQYISPPLIRDILTALLGLKKEVIDQPRNLLEGESRFRNSAIQHVLNTAHRYCKIFDDLNIKVTAEILMLTEQPAQEDKNSQGCVKQHEYKWQRVQKKVENLWKTLKREGKSFPSYRSIAIDIGENPSTVKKAILYSRPLTTAYNKDKPAGKKIKHVKPSTLDYVGKKHRRKQDSPVEKKAQKKETIKMILSLANKYSKALDKEYRATGEYVLIQNKHGELWKQDIELLDVMLESMKDFITKHEAEQRAIFELNRLK